MKAWLVLLSAFLIAPLHAQDKPLRLGVFGDITIDEQGNVIDHQLETQVSEAVRGVVDRAVRKWKFEPVLRDGVPVRARTGMDLELVAEPVAQGLQLRIDQIDFGARRSARKMLPPRYPDAASRVGIEADILLAVRIDAAGKVTDLFAVQTVLRDGGKVLLDNRWQRAFESTTLAAAKAWRFEPATPDMGETADETVIVPVGFMLEGASPLAMSGWHPDEASARKLIPWLPASEQDYDPTGLKDGEAMALGASPVKLKSPVVGTTL